MVKKLLLKKVANAINNNEIALLLLQDYLLVQVKKIGHRCLLHVLML